ncbi:Uncharacterized protein TCM_004682 [Theobroma cacao]|uniref:Uncharacterized protein n=1 Tax=Theobroma cacao TaxID=3641 RepID=A0A061DSQ7_THECC|nr:Uncharacterized protein TCM_004682 [Theobroma cacao]
MSLHTELVIILEGISHLICTGKQICLLFLLISSKEKKLTLFSMGTAESLSSIKALFIFRKTWWWMFGR